MPKTDESRRPRFGGCKDMLTVVNDDDEHLTHFAEYMPMARQRHDELTPAPAVFGVPATPEPGALASVPTETLRTELARGLALTAETLTRLGTVWAELERRGEDLSDLRRGLARTLPLIAAGRLAAESVVAFAGRPSLLRALEGVSLERQRALAAGEALAVIDPADPASDQKLPLAELPSAAIRLVFSDGEIRSPVAQRLALRPRQRRRHSDEEEESRRYRPRFDQAAGTVTIGRMTVRLADLLDEVAGRDLPALIHAEEYLTVKVRLSPEEHKKLLEAARRAELPEWEMARKALRAFGLI